MAQRRNFFDLEKHRARVDNCGINKEVFYKQNSARDFDVKLGKHTCNSYFCEHCRKIKRAKLLNRFNKIKGNTNLRFITLTLSTNDYDTGKSIESISNNFNELVKLLRYRNYKFEYFKIIEFTKNDVAHIHALVTCYLPQPLLSALWRQITGSYIVSVNQKYTQEKLYGYVTKYVTKAMTEFANLAFFLYRKRRFSTSRFFFLPVSDETGFHKTGLIFQDANAFKDIAFEYFKRHFYFYKFLKLNFKE